MKRFSDDFYCVVIFCFMLFVLFISTKDSWVHVRTRFYVHPKNPCIQKGFIFDNNHIDMECVMSNYVFNSLFKNDR